MNGLTRDQAYQEMKKGNKIDHWLFSSDEYLWIDKQDNIRDEKGYYWEQENWDERNGGNWNDGWGIWKGDK